MVLSTLQLSIGGGVALAQSMLLLYQYRKLKQFKKAYHQVNEALDKSRKFDEITGAQNYHFFVKAANLAIKNARRKRSCVSMILVDINDLEKINLRHSFQAGNALLGHLYRQLKKLLPDDALIGRFGGSGFFILLDRCNEEQMLEQLELLSLYLEEDHFKIHRKKIPYEIAMAGITLHGRQIYLTTLLERVEEGLEIVKESRRRYGVTDRSGKMVKVA